MRGRCKSFAMMVLVLLAACGAPAASGGMQPAAGAGRPAAPAQAQNIILLIGDGVGTAYWTAAKLAADSLAVQRMPVVGLVDTRSADRYVTDSAAGATVYATGQRTYNGAIGVGMRCLEMIERDREAVARNPAACDPLETVLQVAKRNGMSTGLVATSTITHATPASFAAHVPNRAMQPEIAVQLARAPIDVLLGGGRGFFDGSTRPDSFNLLLELCQEARCINAPEELRAYQPDDRRLVGLFAQGQMPPAAERQPTLPEMTRVALDKLGRNPRGFFVMIEGSQPDWAGHDNLPLPAVVDEMVDFDRAIAVTLDFARRTPGTLVLVVADHETGGLALVEPSDTVEARYSTTGHSGEMIPLFAYGPGAERFGGIKENYEIGRLLMEIVRARR